MSNNCKKKEPIYQDIERQKQSSHLESFHFDLHFAVILRIGVFVPSALHPGQGPLGLLGQTAGLHRVQWLRGTEYNG